MIERPRSRGWTTVATAGILALAGCVLPSDESATYTVSMPKDVLQLTVGDTARLGPTVTHSGAPDSMVVLDFTSSDPSIAIVDSHGLVRGIKAGITEVTASARRYAHAATATRQVLVLRGVQIDTVIPTLTQAPGGHTVMWGEPVLIVGRGLDPSTLGPVLVNAYSAAIDTFIAAPTDDPTAEDTLGIWIPAPAPDSSNLFVSRSSGQSALWRLNVIQHDLLEPNDDMARTLTLADTALRFPGLALEVTSPGPQFCWSVWSVPQGQCWSDAYELSTPPGARDVTMIFKFATLLSVTPVAIEVQSKSSDVQGWLIAPNWSLCDDSRGAYGFFAPTDHPFQSNADSFMIPLKNVDPSGIIFSLTLFGEATPATPAPTGVARTTPYEMRIVPQYLSELPPDTAEENDFCHGAFRLTPPQTLALTFDHGGDLDWFKFTVPGTPANPTGPGSDVTETEPNDAFSQADTVPLGTRVDGTINPAGDVDNWAFYADSGAALDLDLRADRDGESTLNSMLLLFYGGEVLAINDDISVTTFDSRINYVAPASGWYTVQVRSATGRGSTQATYVMSIATDDPASVNFSATVTAPSGTDPVVQLWEDHLLDLGNIDLDLEGAGSVQSVIPPGNYLLLVYDRNGKASPYQLSVAMPPVSAAARPMGMTTRDPR